MEQAVNYKDNTATHNSEGVVDSTIACGVGAVIVRFVVIAAGVIVFRNFGNGLKEKCKLYFIW